MKVVASALAPIFGARSRWAAPLLGAIYALQNIANLNEAHAALGYVLSAADHEVYPSTLFFNVSSPSAHWAALALVIVGELAIGFFGIKGAWDMFAARDGTAEQFHAAKSAGLWAAGLALLIGLAFS